ncbi:MAG TPA: hypothetical protein VHA56_10315 [Mucilaginibacter sp.]|nr:hypothetical protein [Mucilaginibacter sp.]
MMLTVFTAGSAAPVAILSKNTAHTTQTDSPHNVQKKSRTSVHHVSSSRGARIEKQLRQAHKHLQEEKKVQQARKELKAETKKDQPPSN